MTRTTRRTAITGAVLLAATLLVSGCSSTPPENGVVSMSGSDAFTATDAAVSAQDTVRVVSKGTQSGLPLIVDMRLRRGGGAIGTVSLGSDTIDVVSNGPLVFLRADAAYWTARYDKEFADGVGDKWVQVPRTSTSFASFANLTDYATMTHGLLVRDPDLTNGGQGSMAGQPAVQLVGASGSIWVASQGTPLPVQVDEPASGTVLRYGEWNAEVTVVPPSSGETVDLAALGID